MFWAKMASALQSALQSAICVVGRRCSCSFASPACLQIVCGAIRAKKASGCVVLMKHSQESINRSLHLFKPRKLNPPLLFFSDHGPRFLDQTLRFLYRGAGKPSFGHFDHVQGQAHDRLFQVYTTSLRCHHSRHVKYQTEISCCFKQYNVAITSTIDASIPFSKVITACFTHSRGCLSGYWSANLQSLQHDDVRFCGVCGQMPWLTIKVSHCGEQ